MASRKRSLSNEADIRALHKEWDEVSCPICMDHPHNAVLLLCSSHDKGCRSYICDTSHRHSNCLDQFKKLRADNRTIPTTPSLSPSRNLSLRTTSDLTEALGSRYLNESDSVASAANSRHNADWHRQVHEGILEAGDSEFLWEMSDPAVSNADNSSESRLSLRCPLCRGSVLAWKVVEEARKYLNLKRRSCSRESCSFFGNYRELRRHARRVHPTARPADIDPSRQRAWRCLEDHREHDDIVSAVRSAMPGAIVLGDYVIENGNRLSGEREMGLGENSRRWWTTYFLFQMFDSIDSTAEPRSARSRVLSRHHRSTGVLSRRRFLWGENLLGLQDDDDDDGDDDREDNDPYSNIVSDMDEDASPNPRRRRRLTRYRSDEDQS